MEPRSEDKLKPTRCEDPEEPVSLEFFFERMDSARFLVAYVSGWSVVGEVLWQGTYILYIGDLP